MRSTLLPSGLTPIGRVIPPGIVALRSCKRFMPGTRILNQDCGRAMLCRQTDDLAAQVRIFEATPIDMNEVRIAFMDKPSRACRIVVATARHHGDVPALDDPRFPGPRRQFVLGREPRPPA